MGEKLTVGQQLWYVPRDLRWAKPHFVTVEKVGRKWAALSNRERADIADLRVDNQGYGYSARCFLTRDEWEEACRRDVTWGRISHFVRNLHGAPKDLDRQALVAIAQALGGDQLLGEIETALEALSPSPLSSQGEGR